MKRAIKAFIAAITISMAAIVYTAQAQPAQAPQASFEIKENADGTITLKADDFKRLVKGMRALEKANDELMAFAQALIQQLQAHRACS